MTNFLESDPAILDDKLKFVKSFEDGLDEIFSGSSVVPTENCKIVKPLPGVCIKAYKLNSNEKFFINLCQTDGIPSPEEISAETLTEILESETPSSFRIPMSISQPRVTKDKSENPVDVCDIAVNPTFFAKCVNILLFRDFLIGLIFEALDDKYNIQLNTNDWLILKNRKFIGNLVKHRVQDRDVKTVLETYKSPSTEDKKLITELNESEKIKLGQKLVQEISEKEVNVLKKTVDNDFEKSQTIKQSIAIANSKIPEYKTFTVKKNGLISEILAEFWLPDCISAHEIKLDIGEDRIFVESMKRGYLFDKFLHYRIDQNKVAATFDATNKMLRAKMGVLE